MPTPTALRRGGRLIGKVYADVTLTNAFDDELRERGEISSDQVRSVHVADVLVDTGATHLCLPRELIEQLGLRLLEEVQVATAAGLRSARRFRNVFLTVEGRSGTFDCIELPGGDRPLLGVVPLETLGLEPDLANERLRLLPMTENDTYITIL